MNAGRTLHRLFGEGRMGLAVQRGALLILGWARIEDERPGLASPRRSPRGHAGSPEYRNAG